MRDATAARGATGDGGLPDAFEGLGAVARVARTAVSVTNFDELARRTLKEICGSLRLDIAALYLPDPTGRATLLQSAVVSEPAVDILAARALEFDDEAWRMVTTAPTPLIFRESASWLVEHPFVPARADWLILPLVSSTGLVGAVVAAGSFTMELSTARITTLISIGDLLSAAVATGRLRLELERTAVERERMRLAAELHDGLAQDLALAVREVASLRASASYLPGTSSGNSLDRLAEAVTDAHRVVRAGLEDLTTTMPLGGVTSAIGTIAERFRQRGVTVDCVFDGAVVTMSPDQVATVLRVLNEALANVLKHATDLRAGVLVVAGPDGVRLIVEDGGPGWPDGPLGRPGDGHFGLTIMRERARAVGAEIELGSAPGGGARVELIMPLGGSSPTVV